MNIFPDSSDFIDIHSHNPEQRPGIFRIQNVFTSDFPEFPADRPVSIGLHPWHINDESVAMLDEVMQQIQRLPNLLAIGESGLDGVIKIPMNLQIEIFRKQIEISRELKKPLIIHCVKGYHELFKLKMFYPGTPSWIVHGFNASPEIASECIKLGIYISLSQRLFRNPDKAGKIVASVPLSMIFAETDDDPLEIEKVYEAVAGAYSLRSDALKSIILENYNRVFE